MTESTGPDCKGGPCTGVGAGPFNRCHHDRNTYIAKSKNENVVAPGWMPQRAAAQIDDEGDMQARHPMYRYRWGTTIQRGYRTALFSRLTDTNDPPTRGERIILVDRLLRIELGGL